MKIRKHQVTYQITDSDKTHKHLALILIFVTVSFLFGYIFGYLHGNPAGLLEINFGAFSQEPSIINKPTPTPTTDATDDTETFPLAGATTSTALTKEESTTIDPPKKDDLPQKNPAKKGQGQGQGQAKATMTDNSPTTVAIASTENKSETIANPYLVQVGLFARKDNASSFVERLKKGGFKAFFKDFISTSGIEKYYVRLGPFAKKNTAQENMADFQELHNMPAYIMAPK